VSANSVAVGQNALVSGNNSTAIGQGAVATGASSTALGQGASATFANSTAIGVGAATTRANQVAVGSATNTYIPTRWPASPRRRALRHRPGRSGWSPRTRRVILRRRTSRHRT
jgi:hypothetical protein